jgi:hypothetical protein
LRKNYNFSNFIDYLAALATDAHRHSIGPLTIPEAIQMPESEGLMTPVVELVQPQEQVQPEVESMEPLRKEVELKELLEQLLQPRKLLRYYLDNHHRPNQYNRLLLHRYSS